MALEAEEIQLNGFVPGWLNKVLSLPLLITLATLSTIPFQKSL
jgi:hypothetical protein